MNLRGHGITEDQIISLNKFLENNGYNIDMKSTGKISVPKYAAPKLPHLMALTSLHWNPQKNYNTRGPSISY
jgi:hypothetical protein